MEPMTTYTSQELIRMNYGSTWRNCIVNDAALDTNKSGRWELHATGDCDLDGRKYISLPAGIVLTLEIKKKYNII